MDRRDTEELTVEAVSSLKLLVDLMVQHPANNSCIINITDHLWPFNQRFLGTRVLEEPVRLFYALPSSVSGAYHECCSENTKLCDISPLGLPLS